MKDLTVPQAATLLGLKPRSVRKFIERGMIKGEKRGRDWFISQEEVDRYNRERRKPGPQPGRKQSEATKAKLRAIKLADNPMKGTKHTDEARAKMSARQSQQPRGEKSHAWKGGRVLDTKGYAMVFMPDHPHVINRYVYEHRLVMEQMIGRYLEPNEVVHHKDEDITNNHPENLELMSRGAHSSLHRSKRPNLPRIRAARKT